MCTFFPSIFITSCIRMRGGMYTQFAIFAGDKWAGYYTVVYFITNMSLAMYALSFAEYAPVSYTHLDVYKRQST